MGCWKILLNTSFVHPFGVFLISLSHPYWDEGGNWRAGEDVVEGGEWVGAGTHLQRHVCGVWTTLCSLLSLGGSRD